MSADLLTPAFKAKSGYYYNIVWHETGIEAQPMNGQFGAAYSLENSQAALAEWCIACRALGEGQ